MWRFYLERDLQRVFDGNQDIVAIDVGANVGQTALRFRKVFPDCRVWCFEPIPATFEQLKRNLQSLDRVELEPVALGENEGVAWMSVGASSEQSRLMSDATDHQDNKAQVSVKITTLDQFLKERSIPKVDILKTDCEGFDLDVLKGAKSAFERQIVRAVISEVTFNDRSFHAKFRDIDEYLRRHGHYCFALYDYNGWRALHSEGQFQNGLWLRRPSNDSGPIHPRP